MQRQLEEPAGERPEEHGRGEVAVDGGDQLLGGGEPGPGEGGGGEGRAQRLLQRPRHLLEAYLEVERQVSGGEEGGVGLAGAEQLQALGSARLLLHHGQEAAR